MTLNRIEYLIIGLVGILLLLLLVITPFDIIDFYGNQETYIKVHHLDTTKEFWEWQYLRAPTIRTASSIAFFLLVFMRFRRETFIWKALNRMMVLIFIIAVSVHYYQWAKTGFDH
jgi:hypothetical protein